MSDTVSWGNLLPVARERIAPASWLLAKNTRLGVLFTLGPLNCRAFIANANKINKLDILVINSVLTAIVYLAHLLFRDTQPIAHAKVKEPNPLALFY